MGKFHINPSTGGISLCRARERCPFGGESGSEHHYDSVREAKAHYEEVMEAHKFVTHSKSGEVVTLTTDVNDWLEGRPELAAKQGEYEAAKAAWTEANDHLKKLVKADPSFALTDEHYRLVQERKALHYARGVVRAEREALLPPELKELQAREEAAKAASAEVRKQKRAEESAPYNFHPTIDEKVEAPVQKLLTTLTGVSTEELSARVAALEAAGESKDSAYRKLWKELPLRSDKPIVSIDLEVAASNSGGFVDQGAYSSIIEVGYTTVHPDGRVERNSYLCGVPEDLLQTSGTGAVEVHNITPEMVAGLKPFSEDEEKQAELLATLKGSVMTAHNAKYETGQFKHNLRGFARELEAGTIEVVDTREVCRFFVPEAATNSNESFVEATGGVYEGAHRAGEDAEMSLRALFRAKGAQLQEV